jgi:hypothetical protein
MKAITTTYHGPTNSHGSRIIARDTSDGHSVRIPYDHSLNSDGNHRKAAKQLLNKLGWYGTLATGSVKGAEVHVFVDEWSVWTVKG